MPVDKPLGAVARPVAMGPLDGREAERGRWALRTPAASQVAQETTLRAVGAWRWMLSGTSRFGGHVHRHDNDAASPGSVQDLVASSQQPASGAGVSESSLLSGV